MRRLSQHGGEFPQNKGPHEFNPFCDINGVFELLQ